MFLRSVLAAIAAASVFASPAASAVLFTRDYTASDFWRLPPIGGGWWSLDALLDTQLPLDNARTYALIETQGLTGIESAAVYVDIGWGRYFENLYSNDPSDSRNYNDSAFQPIECGQYNGCLSEVAPGAFTGSFVGPTLDPLEDCLNGLKSRCVIWSGPRTAYLGIFAADITSDAHVRLTLSDTPFGPSLPVPEPATWLTMIFGFGLLGAALRRQRPALAKA
jgi:hypothetical protein